MDLFTSSIGGLAVQVNRGLPGGLFAPYNLLSLIQPTYLTAGDLDGDGRIDVIITTETTAPRQGFFTLLRNISY